MYPAVYAERWPDRPAIVMTESGLATTYAELDARSRRLVQVLRRSGLGVGSTVAIIAENRVEWADVIWATMRSGMTIAPIARDLRGDTLRSVLSDSTVHAVITTRQHAADVGAAADGVDSIALRLCIGGAPGFEDYDEALSSAPDEPLDHETLGSRITYSSGTTGRPKGIRHPRTDCHPRDAAPHLGPYTELMSLAADTVYLSPAPMYHTTPLRFGIAVQQQGGTVVCQQKFDAAGALAAIERYRVTHAQFVPTMLKRILALPRDLRERYDLSSLRLIITGRRRARPS